MMRSIINRCGLWVVGIGFLATHHSPPTTQNPKQVSNG
jgi:hypothetical protein